MATQPPVDEEPFTAEQAAAALANEAFYQAVEDGDLDAVRALWIDGEHADTAHCVHPGQPAVHGRSKVLMSWAVVMSRLSYLQFFITDVRVVVSGEIAVVTTARACWASDAVGCSRNSRNASVASSSAVREAGAA